ncbi:MAG: glycosyltransferase family 2 protein [Pseudomonadales bacterium]|nr:glycosyltransferase family 2 protein [Pseudomonadales bacterium]
MSSVGAAISTEYATPPSAPVPELSVVIPTFNERDNVDELIARLDRALGATAWEAIFVDDDSPDDTAQALRALAQRDPRVRCLRRLRRRGLSSACIEGMLASSANYVAVMDADLQHDPTLLPQMLGALRAGRAELVIGSRYVVGGAVGDWQEKRLAISKLATRLAGLITSQPIADPMSGYFMLQRERFEELAPRLSSMGFKILLDIVATARPPLETLELPLLFGQRHAGESKLSTNVAWEFALLLADKLIGRWVPIRFLSFAFVGALGVAVHFLVLTTLLKGFGVAFLVAQAIATGTAIVYNYTLNNVLTYVDRPRRGHRWLTGLLSFAAICSIGAIANVGVASFMFERASAWPVAALAGILVGAVWNFAVSNVYTWRR